MERISEQVEQFVRNLLDKKPKFYGSVEVNFQKGKVTQVVVHESHKLEESSLTTK